MKYIYLDNSATTELSQAAKNAMNEAMECYGNPSSLHTLGYRANTLLNDSRNSIAAALGVKNPKPGQIIFTGSGSEASNLAIRGTAFAKARRVANVVITTDSEHPSVENNMKELERAGFEIVRLSTKSGVLSMEELDALLKKLFSEGKKVFLISLMLVNNETGALYDVKSAFSAVKRFFPEAITHCDAVQGFMRVKFTPEKLGAELVTVSAHKIHGPKGVGALYVNPEILKAKKISPVIFGGGQESGFRSGTENMIGIAGFAAAAREELHILNQNIAYLTELRNYTETGIRELEGVSLNIPTGERAPHILNITFPSIKSETMLHFLSSKGICVSSGSACSSKSGHTSRSLLSFGLTPFAADCSIRISFSEFNTHEDVDCLVSALREGISGLVKIR